MSDQPEQTPTPEQTETPDEEEDDSSSSDDEQLTEEEIAELRAEFDRIDLDGNGSIDREELKASFVAIDPQSDEMLDQYVDEMFDLFDENKDGGIDFQEFLKMCH